MDSKNNTAEGYEINPGQSEIVVSVLDELSKTPELEKLLEEKGIVLVDSDFINNYRAYLERLSKNNKALATGLEEIKQERDVLLNMANYIVSNFSFIPDAISGTGQCANMTIPSWAGKLFGAVLKRMGAEGVDPVIVYRILMSGKKRLSSLGDEAQSIFEKHFKEPVAILAKHEIVDPTIIQKLKQKDVEG